MKFLTPIRCRIILFCVLALGFTAHLRYLRHDCPIDLSGDEAHYWDWSRSLDIGYYSKGPLVAWIIRASCAVFGDEMWAVRLPALVLAVMTSLLTYWLTLRLFKSDRLALGVVMLNPLVPMFVAGSMLMTIDPPYFFCWGLATAFFALAVLEGKSWAWIGVGVAIGLGALAKYGMLLWPVGMFIFLAIDGTAARSSRSLKRALRAMLRPGAIFAVLMGLFFLIPPVVWNARHGWVTFKHVGTQTGITAGAFNGNFFELVAAQVGALGPPIAVILVAAIVWLFRIRDRRAALLLWSGLPLFAICILNSVFNKVQINWPAAAYFSWMILGGYFLANHWPRWRPWVYGAVAFGIIMLPIAHDFTLLYPLLPSEFEPRRIDPTVKLKGYRELGARLTRELEQTQKGFVLCEDYMTTAQAAFYTKDQPRTFCAGAYVGKRRTQYDIWPDRSLAQPALRGRDAIYVGYMQDEVRLAFDTVERLADEEIFRRGLKIRRFQVWRCRGFKTMRLPEGSEKN